MSDKLAGGIKAGATSVSLPVELLLAADSTALTGIIYSGVTASYWRQGGVRTAITTATLGSVNAAYSSGGFVEVDATNMPGAYRFDVPDAAFATGADWVVISLKVATAFQLNFFFALETIGAAELGARLPAALTGDGNIKADMLRVAGTAQTARDLGGQLDATVASRLSTAGYTAPPSAAANASQVRTELTTELGRIDAAISSRLSTAGYTAPDNANITAIKAKTDLIPADPADASDVAAAITAAQTAITNAIAALNNLSAAAVNAEVDTAIADAQLATAAALATVAGYLDTEILAIKAKTDLIPAAPAAVADIPSAATVAAGVRTELAVELARIDVAISTVGGGSAPTAAQIADAVWDEAVAGHSTAGSTGAAIQAAGSSGDPWSTVLPGAYADGTAGKIVAKLDIGAPEDPVVVIPDAPVDVSLCRVYGYLETVDNRPAANVSITFELLAADPTKSERLISGRKVKVTTDADVVCAKLNLDEEIELTTELFDLSDVVEEAP